MSVYSSPIVTRHVYSPSIVDLRKSNARFRYNDPPLDCCDPSTMPFLPSKVIPFGPDHSMCTCDAYVLGSSVTSQGSKSVSPKLVSGGELISETK